MIVYICFCRVCQNDDKQVDKWMNSPEQSITLPLTPVHTIHVMKIKSETRIFFMKSETLYILEHIYDLILAYILYDTFYYFCWIKYVDKM